MQYQSDDPISDEQLISEGAVIRDGHGKATSIIRSSMAMVSIVASSILICLLLKSKQRLTTTYHRILLGMCISDMIFSLGLALFNVTAPRDVDYYVWNARGNQTSCNAQGFLIYAGSIGILFYSCTLNIYHLIVVKYMRTDSYIRTKVEPWLHGVPIMSALILPLVLLFKQNLNADDEGMCFGQTYEPPHCIGYEDGEVREGFEIECGRGSKGGVLYTYVGFFVTLVGVPIVIAVSLGMIYRSVLRTEKAIDQYGARGFQARVQQQSSDADADGEGDGSSASMVSRISTLLFRRSAEQTTLDRSKSRAVLQKARAYSIAYFLAWTFPIIRTSMRIAGHPLPIAIWYLLSIFNPLSGLYNLCIYMQPKIRAVKRSDSSLSWRQAVGRVLLLPSSVGTRSRDEPNNNGNNHAPQQNIVRSDSSDDNMDVEDEEEKEESYQEQNKGGKVELRRLSSNIV